MQRFFLSTSTGITILLSCTYCLSVQGITITDSFVTPVSGLIACDYLDETPVQMDGSGFTWGGHSNATVSGWRGRVSFSGSNDRLELYANSNSDDTISANYNSTYTYTIFDSGGSATPDQAIDLTSIEADILGTATGQQVRWLVRDASFQWYVSAAVSVSAGTVTQDPSTLSWLRVDAAAETEMNELDADAKHAIANPATLTAGTPDLSAVTGGGVYIETGDTNSSTQQNFMMTEMRWIGNSASVPTPADVTVTVDMTRRRSINGQLSVVRKNLFNVHSSASSFDSTQQQYLFGSLDGFAGRSFGVQWKMMQVPEDGSRPGYWDETTLNNQIASAYNTWVGNGSPGHDNMSDMLTTSHPDTHYPSAQDILDALPNGFRTQNHDANAEFVSKYLRLSYPLPTWYEFSNEINGEAATLGTTWADISTLAKAIADRIDADGLGVNFVGFGGKWPAFENSNFAIWDRDWVEFIDIAGSSMDAYSVHLYSRMGPNSEAIMDMINNYSSIQLGVARPLMITEFGHLTGGTGTLEEQFWQNMRGQNSFFFQFLERGGLMGRCIPFNTSSSTSWPSAMLVETSPGSGVWIWSDMIKLYEFWQDFAGERLECVASDPDLLVHAVQEGTAVRVALFNVLDSTTSVDLQYLTGDASIVSADISRLYWGGSNTAVITSASFNPATTSLTLGNYEAVILTLNLSGTPTGQSENEKQTYFGDAMIQSIAAGSPNLVNVNGIDTAKNALKARLRISAGNISSYYPSAILVNGTSVSMPTDQMGVAPSQLVIDTADLLALEVDVPVGLLAANNTVSVTYSASGGHLAGVVMDVTYGDPIVQDADSDGMSDDFEIAYGGGAQSIDPLYDPQGDGLIALAEFAMGLDPTQNNLASHPTFARINDSGSDYLSITYLKDAASDPYLTIRVLRSTDLTGGTWQSGQTTVFSTTPLGGDVDSVVERSLFPVSSSGSEYLRLEIAPK